MAFAVFGLLAAFAPRASPVGVALSDVPYYRLPFGPDAAGEDRPFWPSRLESATGLFSDPARLPSSAECAACHRQEFQEWAGSLPAIAARDLVYEATVEANEGIVRHPEQGRFCEGCHAPNEMLAGRVTRFVSVPPSEALTEGVAGTGIGLALARDLARLHGGDLVLVPSAVGARFELVLPAGGGGRP